MWRSMKSQMEVLDLEARLVVVARVVVHGVEVGLV